MILAEHQSKKKRIGSAVKSAVGFLLSKRNIFSLWTDFFTPAGTSDEWVSGYAGSILAKISDTVAKDAALMAWRTLEGSRNQDKGWGFSQGVPVDADSTCWVIRLAQELGLGDDPIAVQARQNLERCIRNVGVVTYREDQPIRNFLGISPEVDFCGWQSGHLCVAAALGGVDQFQHRIADVLRQSQNPDGSWPAYWWFENAYTTALAVEVLSLDRNNAGYVEKAVAWAKHKKLIADEKNSFLLAHLLKIFTYGEEWALSDECMNILLANQQENGSWRGSARLRIPLPYETDPVADGWRRWFGAVPSRGTEEDKLSDTFHVFSLDQNSVFTTATVLDAINLYHAPAPEASLGLINKQQAPLVDNELIERFHRDGFVLLRNVFTANEIKEIEPVITEIAYKLSSAEDDQARSSADKAAFFRATGLWENDRAAKDFIFSKRLGTIAAALLKTERVRLYHDQAFFKTNDQGPTPWHQDRFYWPVDTDRILTLWIPLSDVDPSMGSLRFTEGSHACGNLGDLDILSRSPDALTEFLNKNGLKVVNLESIRAGDITAHWGWTVHGALPNQSERARKALTVIYYADGARLKCRINGFNSSVFEQQAARIREADMGRWFPGLKEGDLAASRFTPLV